MLFNSTLEEFLGLITFFEVDVECEGVFVEANFWGFNAAAELVEVIVELEAIVVKGGEEEDRFVSDFLKSIKRFCVLWGKFKF